MAASGILTLNISRSQPVLRVEPKRIQISGVDTLIKKPIWFFARLFCARHDCAVWQYTMVKPGISYTITKDILSKKYINTSKTKSNSPPSNWIAFNMFNFLTMLRIIICHFDTISVAIGWVRLKLLLVYKLEWVKFPICKLHNKVLQR